MANKSLKMGALIAGGLLLMAGLFRALAPAPARVELIEASRGPMAVTVTAEGITRIRDTWTITAPVGGALARSPVDVGDPVLAEETVVAIIEPAEPPFLDARARQLAEASVAEARAAVHLAEANLYRARTELSHFASELTRYRALAERGTLSTAALEDASQAVVSARAARDVAASDLDMRRATLQRMLAQLAEPKLRAAGAPPGECCLQLTSPGSGVVLSVRDLNARRVEAGAPLLTVGDPQDLEVRVDLLSQDAIEVAPGTEALLERWGGVGLLEARVTEVEPSAFTRISALGIEEQRVPVVLELLTPPESRVGLGDQYRVVVRLVLWSDEAVLRVPQSALFRHAGGWALYVAEAGRARLRPVEVGRVSTVWAQILGGVTAGEQVIAYPGAAITPGARVRSEARSEPLSETRG